MRSEVEIVKAFGRFAESGYKRTLFTKPLYHELSQCFGFIAHFDRDGFYAERFGSLAARSATLTIMGEDSKVVAWSLSAQEQLLRTMVISQGLAAAAAKELAVETEQRERAELARLKAKYELDERLS